MKIYAVNALDAANGWPTRGLVEYVQDGARKVAQLSLVAGQYDQSVLHESHGFRADGPTMWAGAWWRFPVGYSWDGAPGYAGREHKLMLFSVEAKDGKGRLMVNAEGSDGHLRAYVEGFDSEPNRLLLDTETLVPLDGRWHFIEAQMDRDAAGHGRVRLWLDGRLAGDAMGTTGNSPFCLVQVGAYVNQGAAKAQSFRVRDFICADERMIGPTPQPQPEPPKPKPGPDLAAARTAIQDALAALDRASKALGN